MGSSSKTARKALPGVAHNPYMTIARSLIILLSLLLCFTVLAQRTHQNLDETYELSSMVDVYGHSVEVASDCDINDASLLPATLTGSFIPHITTCAKLSNFYRQLVISPPRRPPVA
jgi:hypothetical protein